MALLLVLIGFAWPALVGSRPFQSQEQQELARTAQWLSSLLIIAGSLVGLYLYGQRMGTQPLLRVAAAVGILGLVVLTVRTAWRANYINYDNTREFLVYAHGAPAVKQVMAQVEEISQRLTGGLDLKVAFEEDTAWPFTWYLRNYPNQRYMGASASSDVRNYPVVIVGDKNYAKFDPYLKDTHYKFEYIFLWWPMEDYKNLTWERISYALTNPEMREAVWDIIFNRDYEKYGQLTGGNYALSQWPLRHSFRLYLDKKIAVQLWDHTVGPVEPIKPPEDPSATSPPSRSGARRAAARASSTAHATWPSARMAPFTSWTRTTTASRSLTRRATLLRPGGACRRKGMTANPSCPRRRGRSPSLGASLWTGPEMSMSPTPGTTASRSSPTMACS